MSLGVYIHLEERTPVTFAQDAGWADLDAFEAEIPLTRIRTRDRPPPTLVAIPTLLP